MKTTLIAIALSALTSAAWTADYSVFRICEDQRVVRTSDGVDAGHVQYIVIEPGSHRIVSTIVSGGAVGERLVPVPIESVTFQGTNEVVLTQITRERLISAPVIERAQLSSTTIIQPTIVERSFTHFGVRANIDTSAVNRSRTEVNVDARQREPQETRGTALTREQAERDALRSNRSDDLNNTTARSRREGDRNLNDRNERGERRDLSRETRPHDGRSAEERGSGDGSNRPGQPEAVGERNKDRSQSQRPPHNEKNATNAQRESAQRANGGTNRANENSEKGEASPQKPSEKKANQNERAAETQPAPPTAQPPQAKEQSNRAQERPERKREESQSAGERKAGTGRPAQQGEKAESNKSSPGEAQREGTAKSHQKSVDKERQP